MVIWHSRRRVEGMPVEKLSFPTSGHATPLGVSVVICAHNAAARLPTTLDHLRRQEGAQDIPWEVVLVDNGSSDGTAAVARELWDGPVPLRVIGEPRLGQVHARIRGMTEAHYDLISFVDDDNWVASDWIARVMTAISAYPDAGACGGISEPIYEVCCRVLRGLRRTSGDRRPRGRSSGHHGVSGAPVGRGTHRSAVPPGTTR